MHYYNEFDPFPAQWLRNLIAAGVLPAGHVDTRSIADVTPADLAGYTQCHFFAGIGGWPLALQLAGVSPSTRLWTGSCPCQPFSGAGKRKGIRDERHLWPAWKRLIAQCSPSIVLGEQVASADGRTWLAAVRSDLEELGYAAAGADLCAAGIGAAHIRQRIYFVGLADADDPRVRGESGDGTGTQGTDEGEALGEERKRGWTDDDGGRSDGGLADAESIGECPDQARPDCGDGLVVAGAEPWSDGRNDGAAGGLADADDPRPQGRALLPERTHQCAAGEGGLDDGGRPSTPDSFWAAADWLFCRDGKWRPIEPAAQQMVDGISCAMGFLRSNKTLQEELTHASKTSDIAGQIMRAMRKKHAPTEIWWSLGRCIGLPETTLLLAALCEQSRELGEFFYGKTEGCAQGSEKEMPTMRGRASSSSCPSHGRECAEQLSWEPGDALSELSQTCPSARSCLPFLAEYTGSPLAEKVPNRVGRLRGYGNAIVPQIAATFIRAALNLP